MLQERTVRLKSTFAALTVWNLERAPSADDGLHLALSWPGIAEAVSTGVLLSQLVLSPRMARAMLGPDLAAAATTRGWGSRPSHPTQSLTLAVFGP